MELGISSVNGYGTCLYSLIVAKRQRLSRSLVRAFDSLADTNARIGDRVEVVQLETTGNREYCECGDLLYLNGRSVG